MRRAVASAIVLAVVVASRAGAQESNFALVPGANVLAPSGWSFTPGVGVGTGWDSNVLVRNSNSDTPSDVLNIVSPQAALNYNGRRGQLSASYDGAFLLYRTLDTLNSYDQRASLYARRALSKHVGFFVRNTIAFVPTTELADFVAVPFVRTGSEFEDLRAGFDAALTKFTTLAATYDLQLVNFNQDVPGAIRLQGGHSNGGTLDLRHLVSPHFALTLDYQFQHADVQDSQTFDIQNWWAGVDYQVSDVTHVYAAGGVSRLNVSQFGTDRTGPAWRMGLSRSIRTALADVHYSRSFVPSYGFGGTMQNEEATARLRYPLGRRLSASTGVSFRRDDPLTVGALPLRSFWLEGTIAYATSSWFRIEGYFAGTRQTITRADGQLDRNRAGIQIVAAKPMRIP